MLEAMFTRYYARFVRQAARCLWEKEYAEDCVQDAMVKALKHIKEFRGTAALSTWFTRIVINEAYMRNRRAHSFCVSLEEPIAEGAYVRDCIPDPAPDAERTAIAAERWALVRRRMRNAVSPTVRRTLLVHALGDCSQQATAVTMGIPLGTVKARLSRGREALRA